MVVAVVVDIDVAVDIVAVVVVVVVVDYNYKHYKIEKYLLSLHQLHHFQTLKKVNIINIIFI